MGQVLALSHSFLGHISLRQRQDSQVSKGAWLCAFLDLGIMQLYPAGLSCTVCDFY